MHGFTCTQPWPIAVLSFRKTKTLFSRQLWTPVRQTIQQVRYQTATGHLSFALPWQQADHMEHCHRLWSVRQFISEFYTHSEDAPVHSRRVAVIVAAPDNSRFSNRPSTPLPCFPPTAGASDLVSLLNVRALYTVSQKSKPLDVW